MKKKKKVRIKKPKIFFYSTIFELPLIILDKKITFYLYFYFNFFFKFFKKMYLKLKRWKKKLRKLKRRNTVAYKLYKKKKYTKFRNRGWINRKIMMKKNKFRVRSELYRIFIVGFLNRKKFHRNVFMQNQKILYNYTYFSKNFLFKKKIKKKISLFHFAKSTNLPSYGNYYSNITYNNYYPIYNSHSFLIKKFKKIFKSILSKRYFTGVQLYVISFFEYFLKQKFFIKSNTNRFFKKISRNRRKIGFYRLYRIFRKNKRSTLSRVNRFNLMEIIEIVFFSFFYKDMYILKNWFLRNYTKLHYKNQKKFLFFFKIVMTDIFETYKYGFGIKGFYFLLKGKVGVTSNAKKRSVFFRIGPLSKSSKSKKIDFQQGVVKANSGTSGLLMILTYE